MLFHLKYSWDEIFNIFHDYVYEYINSKYNNFIKNKLQVFIILKWYLKNVYIISLMKQITTSVVNIFEDWKDILKLEFYSGVRKKMNLQIECNFSCLMISIV